MSTMPNAHLAVVAEAKIPGYLLNAAHADGAGKAAFFTAIGHSRARWQALQAALEAVACSGVIRAVMTTDHGTKCTIDGELTGSRSGRVAVRTVWIVDRGADVPRLVTAYPVEVHDDERA